MTKKSDNLIPTDNIFFVVNTIAEYRRQFKGDEHQKAIAAMKTNDEVKAYFLKHKIWTKI